MQAGQQGQLQGEGRQPVGGELHLPYKGYWNLQYLSIIIIRTCFCHLRLVSREMVGGRFEMKL